MLKLAEEEKISPPVSVKSLVKDILFTVLSIAPLRLLARSLNILATTVPPKDVGMKSWEVSVDHEKFDNI